MSISRLLAWSLFVVSLVTVSAHAAVDVKLCPKIATGAYKMNGSEEFDTLKMETVAGKLIFEHNGARFRVDGARHDEPDIGEYEAGCENDVLKLRIFSPDHGLLKFNFYDYDKYGNYNMTVRNNRDQILKDVQLMSIAGTSPAVHDPAFCFEYPGPYVFQEGDQQGKKAEILSSRIAGNTVMYLGRMGRFVFDGKPHPFGDNTYIGRCRENSAELRVLAKDEKLEFTFTFSRPNSNKSFRFTEFYPDRATSLTNTFIGVN